MREAVVLRYLMGLPLAKAAKILAVPVGTVNSRLHYARQILATKLGAAAKNPKGKALLLALALAALTAVGAMVAAIVGDARSTPPALSEGTPLSEGGYGAQDSSPLQEGAVAEGDWGSTAPGTSTSPTTGDNMNAIKAARTFAAASLALTSGFATASPTILPAPASLPAGYCQCSYIESTGTQYIDTGVVPTTATRVVSDFRLTAMPSAPVRNGWTSAASKEAFWFGIDNDHSRFSAAAFKGEAPISVRTPRSSHIAPDVVFDVDVTAFAHGKPGGIYDIPLVKQARSWNGGAGCNAEALTAAGVFKPEDGYLTFNDDGDLVFRFTRNTGTVLMLR